MKILTRLMRPKHETRHFTNKEIETRFLRLYSAWHETHDPGLRKRLMVRLKLLMRRRPNYDIRREFQQAF